eukprot:TRINITY_DN19179_c0_g1_i1.p1 TRINITY_DN19179_c0_g1~~TRINITY_DN19179_c0_g1_i1.p1  ORF type:complete len:347 (+),score=38.85 TRINITY_DN19179_c0_g1_i1:62-1102(+)
MVGGGWLELQREEEPLTDLMNSDICDGGVAKLDADAQRVVSREFKRSFTLWFVGGCLLGAPLLLIPRFLMKQRMWHIVTPRQAGMWIGVFFGVSFWSMFIISILGYLLPSPLKYILPIFGPIGAFGSYMFGLALRTKYYYLVDPGPANQIFGLRNVGTPFSLRFSKVMKTPFQTVPVSGVGTSPPSVDEVSERVTTKIMQPLRVAMVVGACNLVIDFILHPLGYIGHFVLMVVIVIVADAIGCFIARRSLVTINNHPLMVRRNINWVLRGYNFPFKIYSLWLVRTDPNYVLVKGFAGWYHYCSEEFKKAAKLFLLATSSSLPRDVALLALEYGSTHIQHVTIIPEG